MPRITGFLLAMALLPPTLGMAQGYPIDAGIDVQHYQFALTLRDTTDVIEGSTRITVRVLEPNRTEVAFDLIGEEEEGSNGMAVLEVSRGGEALPFIHTNDRLVVTLENPIPAGAEFTLSIRYRGTPSDGLIIGTNRYGERTFFGDNWPDRARHWLPTVDHVSDKATVEWMVTAPEDYEVIATGRLVERSDLPDGTEFTHWVGDVPIPPKVMVMGAARFAIRTLGQVGSIPIQAWVYPEDREAGFHDFEVSIEVVEFFEELIGPFPYAKLAHVQSKTRYGGMENAGNIFYSERAVRGDGANEGLIAHEVAHQWFGDSVTESDWTHIWLSEGFATYLTHVYMAAQQGPERMREGLTRDRRTVTQFHQQAPDLPLVPEGYEDPGSLLNRNAYQKGSWVLHMLRHTVEEDSFWEGLRTFYQRYRDGNASTDDFRAVMEEVSGQDLGTFFYQWTKVPGHPILKGDWSYDGEVGTVTIELSQTQSGGGPFQFPLDIGVAGADGRLRTIGTVELSDLTHTFVIELDGEPVEVVLDPDVWLLHEGSVEKRSLRIQPVPEGW